MNEKARSEVESDTQTAAKDLDGGLYDELERRAPVAWAKLAATSYVIVNTGCLLGVNWLDTAARGGAGGIFWYLFIGLLIGILFSQAICFTLWSSWGRGSHFVRFLLLLATQAIFIFVNIINGLMLGPGPFVFSLILIAGLLVVLVFPFAWLIRFLFGMRIVHRSIDGLDRNQKLQFGILHIMGITVITSFLLAIGQALSRYKDIEQLQLNNELLIFLFLMLAAILIAIPVFAACLVDRHISWMLLIATLSALTIGAIEHPIYAQLPLRPGPDRYHFLAINIVTFVNVLSFSIGMRLLGYRLTIGSSR